jgi:excisionase family DNA binding protein
VARRRRTQITVETERLVIIRQREADGETRCPVCAERPRMISAEEAAAVTGLSRRAIYRLVESGRIHFNETSDGVLLICLALLRRA